MKRRTWYVELLAALVIFLMLTVPACAQETYTGVGQGHVGEITVNVVVDNGTIVQVDVVSHSETAGICDAAISQIPAAIVAANSTQVDAVSNATHTSEGIIQAVNAALAQAGMQTEKQPAAEAESKEESPYAPRVITLENGVKIQRTPDAGYPWGMFNTDPEYKYFNTMYFNADNRGCQACHDLEQTLRGFGHVLYKGRYPKGGMTYQDCLSCHSYEYTGRTLQQSLHARHNGSTAFNAMGGSCESCHYIDENGNYLRWDYVKYDVLHGITDIAADSIAADISWNQEETTAPEHMMGVYYDQYSYTPDELGYTYDHVEKYRTENYMDELKIRFSGDIGNPCELSINEMIELFGTETRVIGSQCVINGIGGSLVYQREVTGIPVKNMLEYFKPSEKANLLLAMDLVGYGYPHMIDLALEKDAILVYQMDGEPLTADQGFPLALWYEGVSLGQFVRNVFEITIFEGDPATATETHGYDYKDAMTGYYTNTPNIGVLNCESGTIWAPGETVQLKGYANAFDKPIVNVEFSFDHGATWKTVETKDATTDRLVFWELNIKDLAPGSYVLYMRTACQWDDETVLANQEIPKFLINVKE